MTEEEKAKFIKLVWERKCEGLQRQIARDHEQMVHWRDVDPQVAHWKCYAFWCEHYSAECRKMMGID